MTLEQLYIQKIIEKDDYNDVLKAQDFFLTDLF